MIKVTHPSGQASYLAASAIVSITDAGASSQWHGIKSYVKLFDSKVLECQETAAEIIDMVQKESK